MTYQQIQQEVYPAYMQLIQSQNQGLVILPQKASYALGKNYTILARHLKAHAKLKGEIIEAHVLKDENGNYKTVKTATGSEYEFKEGQRAEFIQKVKELNETEVECKFHAISRVELESINNFPIHLYPVLEDYGMITELHLETPKMQKVLN